MAEKFTGATQTKVATKVSTTTKVLLAFLIVGSVAGVFAFMSLGTNMLKQNSITGVNESNLSTSNCVKDIRSDACKNDIKRELTAAKIDPLEIGGYLEQFDTPNTLCGRAICFTNETTYVAMPCFKANDGSCSANDFGQFNCSSCATPMESEVR